MVEERVSENNNFTANTAKILNTTVIASKVSTASNVSERLQALMRTPAFQFFLQTIKSYSRQRGISEQDAASELFSTIKELDDIWDSYIYQEGLDKLKAQLFPK